MSGGREGRLGSWESAPVAARVEISGGGARPDSGDLAPRMSCAGAHTSPAKPQLMVARACSRFRGQWPEGRATRLRDPRMLLREVEDGKNFFLSYAVTGEIGGRGSEAARDALGIGTCRPRDRGRISRRRARFLPAWVTRRGAKAGTFAAG